MRKRRKPDARADREERTRACGSGLGLLDNSLYISIPMHTYIHTHIIHTRTGLKHVSRA